MPLRALQVLRAVVRRASIGTTSTDGLVIENPTAAASGAPQYSPRLRLRGYGWKSNAPAESQPVDWRIEVQTEDGATGPRGVLQFASSINGGAYAGRLALSSGGTVTVSGGPLTINSSTSGHTDYLVLANASDPGSGSTSLRVSSANARGFVRAYGTNAGLGPLSDAFGVVADLTASRLVLGSSAGDVRFYANDAFNPGHVILDTSGRLGIGNMSPARRLEALDASAPQLRLTHTAATVYCDFQCDSSGYLTISPSGGRIVLAAASVVMASLPTSDPGVAGALWVDPSAGRVVKSSAG